MIDLSKEEHAYFIGFIQCDGSLSKYTRNRGKLSIEIGDRDKSILDKIKKLFKIKCNISCRTRKTNFKKKCKSYTLTICDYEFRKELVKNGIQYGRKSDIVRPPNARCLNKIAYLRGLIDADGSVGLTKTGKPFISFCTKSEFLKDYYIKFISDSLKYTPAINKNKRDQIYNIMIMGTRAKVLIKLLYENAKIFLKRKRKEANKAITWSRNINLRNESHPKRWTSEEDLFIKSHTIEESSYQLKRSALSISMRKWRIDNKLPLAVIKG